ncbi:MAG TPA: hypothetical protein VMV10_22550 [Pirellulales bacterium]|nr:hypothetical protein [Pirellulales bacterium]
MSKFDEDDNDTTIPRSPRGPSISLAEAVVKTKAIYDADKTAGSPVDAALKHMGYKSRSGPATAALGALKRFGLVESRNGRLVPTARAVSIICLPETDRRRIVALKEAALAPGIYRELFDKYRETGMPSLESLKHELILDGRFNHNAVNRIAEDFVSSFKYAGLTDDSGAIVPEEPPEPLPPPPSTRPVTSGSYVRCLSSSPVRFERSRRVVGVSHDKKWAFVEGVETGIQMEHLAVDRDYEGAPHTALPPGLPPHNPYFKPEEPEIGDELRAANCAKAQTKLDEGPAVLTWPDELSRESFEEFEYWLKGVIRRARRKAGLAPESQRAD